MWIVFGCMKLEIQIFVFMNIFHITFRHQSSSSREFDASSTWKNIFFLWNPPDNFVVLSHLTEATGRQDRCGSTNQTNVIFICDDCEGLVVHLNLPHR